MNLLPKLVKFSMYLLSTFFFPTMFYARSLRFRTRKHMASLPSRSSGSSTAVGSLLSQKEAQGLWGPRRRHSI